MAKLRRRKNFRHALAGCERGDRALARPAEMALREMSSIALDRVTRAYSPNAVAVCDLSLEVNQGEYLAIVGPSGAGKTTVLRLIAGLERPDAGRVLLDGHCVNSLAPWQRAVTMTARDQALYPDWTVDQLLKQSRRATGGVRSSDSVGVEALCQTLGIAELKNRRPGQLSSGERQRVALARSVTADAPIGLFDEPFAGLDAPQRWMLRHWMKERHTERGRTWLHVTHDSLEAMSLGDRIAVMRSGQIVQIGSPEEIYSRPRNRWVAELTSSHRIAWLLGEIQTENHEPVWVSGGLRVALAERAADRPFAAELVRVSRGAVLAGLRPESVSVEPLSGDAAAGGAANQLTGKVVSRENDGARGFALVELDVLSAVPGARRLVGVSAAFVPLTRVCVQLDLSKALWFDADSGNNLFL